MQAFIHFRSAVGREFTIGESKKWVLQRSGDISGIHPYQPHDDAKDIAWKASAKFGEIYAKEHFGYNAIPIRSIYIRSDDPEKDAYMKLLYGSIEQSAKKQHYPFGGTVSEYNSFRKYIDKLSTQNKGNELIIIIIDSIEPTDYAFFEKIAYRNDIILCPILFRSELFPLQDMLFESRLLGKKYKSMIEERMKILKKVVMRFHGTFLPIFIEEDPIIRLNHFFKYRYAQGR